MAGFTLAFAPTSRSFGRSGYNKDGDDSETKPNPSLTAFGRSGYNTPEANYGRSGYNKDGTDGDDGENKGRSGYNSPTHGDE